MEIGTSVSKEFALSNRTYDFLFVQNEDLQILSTLSYKVEYKERKC